MEKVSQVNPWFSFEKNMRQGDIKALGLQDLLLLYTDFKRVPAAVSCGNINCG